MRPYTAPSGSKVLHLDMDSFFATVEQQARPHLRGRPLGISIAPSRGGTIIGSSIEAKRQGVGTGTRVGEARLRIPDLAILKPNPARYRDVHKKVRAVMADYTPEVRPRSIDEIAIWLSPDLLKRRGAAEVAAEIKGRVRSEIGEWLSSSIGIGPNWWLAKTASSFDKPDGLVEFTRENTRERLKRLQLTDLCGINVRMDARLRLLGINTPVDLYDSDPVDLKRQLGIIGYYWWRRLHGYALDTAEHYTRTMGHSSVVPRPTARLQDLRPLLAKLCERTARRLRKNHWQASAVSVYLSCRDAGGYKAWRRTRYFSDGAEMLRVAWHLLQPAKPAGPVRKLAVRASELLPATPEQLELLPYRARRQRAVRQADRVNDKWGELTVHNARMIGTENIAKDSIAFGQDMAHPSEPIHIRTV